jgi:hypothetical protein
MEKKKPVQPSDILSLFVLMEKCENKVIASAFDSFKKVLLEKNKDETLKAYRELLKASYPEIKYLDKKHQLNDVYAEMLSVASLVLDFCLGENRRAIKTEEKKNG